MARLREEVSSARGSVGVINLYGPITVAYRRSAGMWLCTVLQFDIVGIGKTREVAFSEMRDLLADYFEEVLASPGPVRFFNPSEPREWNIKKQEHYNVTFVVSGGHAHIPKRPSLSNIGRLRACQDAIQGMDLVPAGA